MTEAVYGVNSGSHIPGGVMHRYLTDYAKHFKVFERCRFNTRCVKLEPNEAIDGWTLTTTPDDQPTKTSTLTSRKVILATGLTSTPNLPVYAGADKFDAPIFHAKDFCRRADTLASSENVVVVGGAKSAYDVAWAYADAGAQVHIVMRPDGNGPIWISRPWVMGGKKRLEKLLHVRFMQWFSPCPWAEDTVGSWPRRFLHGTRVGRWIVDKFWATLGADVLEVNGWKQTDETKKLIPWHSPFWIASGLSIHNYDTDFFDMVKDGRVKIHVENIDHLSPKAVHLTNGTKLDADVLVCSTGWKKESTIEFSKFGTAGIGLPQDKQEQIKLSAAADHQILEMYPRLKNQPELKFKPKYDPFRLYRFMVPPARVHDRNIAFAGMVSSVSTAVCSAVQGLWISAFFDGHLDRLATTQKDVTDEVMLHTTFFVSIYDIHLLTSQANFSTEMESTHWLWFPTSRLRFRCCPLS